MKIGYIETFPVIGHDRWQKLPLEVEVKEEIDFLNATDEEIEAFMLKVRRVQYALKKQVQSFFYESNKAAEKQLAEVKQKTIIDDINACTNINGANGLKGYHLLAQSKPEWKEAYDKKLLELSQKD